MYPPHPQGGYWLVWESAVDHLRARGNVVRVLTTDTRTDTVEPDAPDVHRELRWPLRGARLERLGRGAGGGGGAGSGSRWHATTTAPSTGTSRRCARMSSPGGRWAA